MQQARIQLNQYATKENTIESFVCFRRFMHFLEEKIITGEGLPAVFYSTVLGKMKLIPELADDRPFDAIENKEEVFGLAAAIIFPLADDEAVVGITGASAPDIYIGTPALYRLFEPAEGGHAPQSWLDETSLKEVHRQFQYQLALQKIYGYELPGRKEMLHSLFNGDTGLYQYYRINMDTRFVEIKIKQGLEKVCNVVIRNCIDCNDPVSKLEQVISLDHFTASGFSILTLTEVTAQEAAEQIGKALVNIDRDNIEAVFIHVSRLLQTMLGSSNYRIGILPFFTINNRTALPYRHFTFSILIDACTKAGVPKTDFDEYINHYINKPGWIIYRRHQSHQTFPSVIQKALDDADVYCYALLPVYFNGTLVGILEIAVNTDRYPVNDLLFTKLAPAFPYLAQLHRLLIDQFNAAIETIVKDKFTNIQSSVQWKFNEVAWHYYRRNTIEHRNAEPEKIFFKEVHPLYGAIDVRNSTLERNQALRDDLQYQLTSLIDLLVEMYDNSSNEQLLNLAELCQEWRTKMNATVSVEEEFELNNFLYSEVHPQLIAADHLPVELSGKMSSYFQSIDEQTGDAFLNRRRIENSMQLLNKVIGRYFDLFNDELQANYPCYFEKFRTDGVEYDIYIGQSIAPAIPFQDSHLERLRLWQLQSMAAIAKLTHDLQPQMEYPLHSTQLIYINGRTIDISFRNDERHFDVEGAYNIRYHIVKKRIDKVHIRNSEERLTQPGKIALVYFNEKDAKPYVDKIQQLQELQILADDLEYLELEELQGVTGLKALRVGVKLVVSDASK